MNKQDKEFLYLVGCRVTEARIKMGLLQEQVATMLNVSRPQVVNIEKGNCGTTLEMIFKLSIILNCPIVELFPTHDQYKPKLKLPLPKKTRPGRKERGPNTSKPAYILQKENELLKKKIDQLANPTTNDETK